MTSHCFARASRVYFLSPISSLFWTFGITRSWHASILGTRNLEIWNAVKFDTISWNYFHDSWFSWIMVSSHESRVTNCKNHDTVPLISIFHFHGFHDIPYSKFDTIPMIRGFYESWVLYGLFPWIIVTNCKNHDTVPLISIFLIHYVPLMLIIPQCPPILASPSIEYI